MKRFIIELFFENKTYKLAALFISLFLWVNISGKKGLGLSHKVPLQIFLAPGYTITNELPKNLILRLSGPETGVKRYIQRRSIISIDASSKEVGWQKIVIQESDLKTPVGVKVLSIKPSTLRVHIEKTDK